MGHEKPSKCSRTIHTHTHTSFGCRSTFREGILLSYCLTFSHVYLILLDQPESIAMDIHDLQIGVLA